VKNIVEQKNRVFELMPRYISHLKFVSEDGKEYLTTNMKVVEKNIPQGHIKSSLYMIWLKGSSLFLVGSAMNRKNFPQLATHSR